MGNGMEDSEIEGEDSNLVKWSGQKGSDYEDGEVEGLQIQSGGRKRWPIKDEAREEIS